MKDVRDKARELLKGYCRVCPVCDGRACAGEVPGMGGMGSGSTFKANFQALQAVKLNLRTMHDINEPDTKIEIMGHVLSLPVMAAPVAGMKLNFGGVMSEEEYAQIVAEGCLSAGTLAWLGDGPHEELFTTILSVLGATEGKVIPVIKPWVDQMLIPRLEQVAEAGAPYAVVDVDAAGFAHLRRMGTPVTPRSVEQWSRIMAEVPLPIALKGIMTPDEALKAADAGAVGIVVSNHGGRVLEGGAGTAEVLPAIAAAAKGKIPLLVDGAVRSGGDVLKMLALGADAVLIGRPLAVAAIGGGSEGVVKYIRRIMFELIQSMILTGCPHAGAATSDLIWSGTGA